MAEEVDEFGIPIRRSAATETDEFGIPIKKKLVSAPASNGGSATLESGSKPVIPASQSFQNGTFSHEAPSIAPTTYVKPKVKPKTLKEAVKDDDSYLGALWNTVVGSASDFAGGMVTLGIKSQPTNQGLYGLADFAGQKASEFTEQARTNASSKENEEKLQSGFDLTNPTAGGIAKAVPLMLTRLVGDIGLSIPTGGASFIAQGYKQGLDDYDKEAAKNGIKPDGNTRELYGVAYGFVNGVADQIGAGSILKNSAVGKYAKNAIVKAGIKELAKIEGKITTEAIEKTMAKVATQTFNRAKAVGVKAAVAGLTEGGTETAQGGLSEGLKLIANKIQGEDVFNADEVKSNFWKNRVNDLAGGALMGGTLGAVSHGIRSSDSYIAERVAENSTKEGIWALKGELLKEAESGELSDERFGELHNSLEKYGEIAAKIPQGISVKNRAEAIKLIAQRDAIKEAKTQVNSQTANIDEALKPQVESEVAILENKEHQLNDQIRENTTGDKYKYVKDPEKDKWYKQLGDNKPEEITLEYYDLQKQDTGIPKDDRTLNQQTGKWEHPKDTTETAAANEGEKIPTQEIGATDVVKEQVPAEEAALIVGENISGEKPNATVENKSPVSPVQETDSPLQGKEGVSNESITDTPIENTIIAPEITPNKGVAANQKIAAQEVSKARKIKEADGEALFSGFKNKKPFDVFEDDGSTEIHPDFFVDGEKVPPIAKGIYQRLGDKGLIEEYDDKYYLTNDGKEFIDAVQARLDTRKGIKAGTDMFPSDAGLSAEEAAKISKPTPKAGEGKELPSAKEAVKKVNETGLYHGGSVDIADFDEAKMGSTDGGFFGKGIYLTPDHSEAASYVKKDDYSKSPYEKVGKYKVDLKNPLVVDASELSLTEKEIPAENDGVIVMKDGEVHEVVLRDKSQAEKQEEGTAIKNADVAEKRIEFFGEDNTPIVEYKSNESLVEEAKKEIADEFDVQKLMDEAEDGKELTDKNVVHLKLFQLAKEGEIVNLNTKIEKAIINGEKASVDRLIQERDLALTDLQRSYDIGKKSGTASARALQARRVTLLNDYSLANLLIRKRSANGGEKLTTAQIDEVSKAFQEIKEKNEALEAKVKELEAKSIDTLADKAFKKLKNDADYEKRKFGRVIEREAIDRDIDQTLANLRKKLKEGRKQLNSGISPEIIPEIAKLAKLYAKKGAVSIEGVIDNIYTQLKDDIEGLDREEIKALLATYDFEGEAKQEARLAQYKKRATEKIDDVRDRLNRKDFSKKVIKPVILDAEAKKLRDDLEKMKHDFDVALAKEEFARRPVTAKAWHYTQEVAGLFRALKATADLSAMLRQGGTAFPSHPIVWSRAMITMFKIMRSEERYQSFLNDIRYSDDYEIIKDSKLAITDRQAPDLTAREEEFQSNWAQHMPIIGKGFKFKAGKMVIKIPGTDAIGISERAYSGFLNKLRVDLFRDGYELLKKGSSGEDLEKGAKALAAHINNLTGRGDLGVLEKHKHFLSVSLFSPRYIASRIRLLTNAVNPVWYRETPAVVRRMYLKDMLSYITWSVATSSLAAMAGASVTLNPFDNDFGKIKDGDTRIDIWSGLSAYVKQILLLAATAAGKQGEYAKGKLDTPSSRVKKGLGQIAHFARGKVSPIPAIGMNLYLGKDYINRDYDLSSIPKELSPLVVGDISAILKENPNLKGAVYSLLAIAGEGVSSYQAQEKTKPAKATSSYGGSGSYGSGSGYGGGSKYK